MTTDRIHNFNAGPSAIPLEVLEEIQTSFLNYKGSGMSVTEISHRSALFDDIINDVTERIRRLLKLDSRYHVLFIHGGASMQFAMIPMNFLNNGNSADYIDTGTWSSKAITEAEIQKKTFRVAASSKDKNYSYIPEDIVFDRNAAFAHITSNNTIKGTQWHTFPDTGGVPFIADMSSDIMSRPLDMDRFGMIYAGAQKNIGPAGVCLVIIRDDLLERVSDTVPTLLRYTTYVEKKSMFNTPPCFTIYTMQLVMKWLEESVGGLEAIDLKNREKSDLIYNVIDGSDFYRGTAEPSSRSLMNVTFRLADEALEKQFVEDALKNGMGGLKGHKSVGGCRASIYNATTLESVTALADYMKTFEKTFG